MKEFKLVLVESKSTDICVGCIFNVYADCHEPAKIDCYTMAPNKNKKYHWEIEEIKPETT